MGPLILLALAAAGPPPTDALEATGGFALIGLAVPGLAALPVVSGDLAWHHRMASSVASSVELGLRYRTHLGAVHRLGPELRGALAVADGWSIGGALYPSASLAGAWQDGVDAGGDVATAALASIAWHHGIPSLYGAPSEAWDVIALSGGLTVEWLLWEHIADRAAVDLAPYPAYVDLAAEWRHGLHRSAWLTTRAEVSIPLDEDPYAPWGVYPRLTFGGGFGW